MYSTASARIWLIPTLLFTLTQRLTNALPTDTSSLLAPDVPADKISTYTTKWFVDNVQLVPDASSCLFYTFDLTSTAQAFARAGENTYTTIWDMWDCALYNDDTTDLKNPLRDILNKESDDRQTYFENMSRAMAQLCTVTATVMTDDVTKIPQEGIWGRIEFPALKDNDKVVKIVAINKVGKDLTTIWPSPERRGLGFSKRVRRQAQTFQRADCYTPSELQEKFGDINW